MSPQMSLLSARPRRSPRPPRSARTPLAAARHADPELRAIVIRVRAWGLGIGRAASTDALTAVVGAAVDDARAGVASPLWWTPSRVHDALGTGAFAYCARRDIPVDVTLADRFAPALSLWLEYLSARRAFATGSQPAASLQAAARAALGPLVTRRRGGRSAHPAGGRRA